MLVPSICGENLLDGFFDDDWMRPGRTGRPAPIPHNLVMKTDIKETDDGFDLAIELPGYTKEDVQAELKDGYMTITATKNPSWPPFPGTNDIMSFSADAISFST